MAAGRSTRLNSKLPKVLHDVCGRPMLGYVLSACRLAGVDRLVVVVGHGKDAVQKAFSGERDVTWVEQPAQHGTGHAVQCCKKELSDLDGSVVVIAGDMPLVRRATVADLLDTRAASGDALVMATTMLDDPTGYGRIIRDDEGCLEAIVEHRDCTDEQRAIREVNPSYYCFDAKRLFGALDQVERNRHSNEIYLTDVVTVFREAGDVVSASVSIAPEESIGVNSRHDLAIVSRLMQDRIQLAAMSDGVTIVDPDNTWIEADVTLGADTVVYPFTFIGAGATIGERCRIGPLARVEAGEVFEDGVVFSGMPQSGASA